MPNIEKSFPANKQEALALLYVQSQDLTSKTPEQIADMYQSAYDKICKHLNPNRNSD